NVARRDGQDRARQPHPTQLFMEKSGEKEELRIAESETVTAFRDSALADDRPLSPLAQRLADHRPFLKTDTLHFAARKLLSRPCPSRSTSIRIRSSRATAFRVRRKISPRPRLRACTGLPSLITTPTMVSTICSRRG